MHPEYVTTGLASELVLEFKCELVRVQHHIAHAYSVAYEHNLKSFGSIVCDGLGYGADGKLWGGEVFLNDKRVGHLEEQYQLGGDSAAEKPAKMLFSILSSFMTAEGRSKNMKKFYTDSEMAVFDKQLHEKYNCPLTSSCGRVLDAASVLLGFCIEREYAGSPAIMLERESGEAYEIEPAVEKDVLSSSLLFRYLILNIDKDKSRLAGTVQQYIVDGLWRICNDHASGLPIVFSGGCAFNKKMCEFLTSKGVLLNKEISCGDQGIAYGQMAYFDEVNSKNKGK